MAAAAGIVLENQATQTQCRRREEEVRDRIGDLHVAARYVEQTHNERSQRPQVRAEGFGSKNRLRDGRVWMVEDGFGSIEKSVEGWTLKRKDVFLFSEKKSRMDLKAELTARKCRFETGNP